MKLILASASPRRAELLSAAGFHFRIVPTETDESRGPGEPVEAMVMRLAEAKARAAAALCEAPSPSVAVSAIVIGADTVVEVDGEVLGKPRSAATAREMLERLSGRSHRVLTGLALVRVPAGPARVVVETTRVWFASLSPAEIEQYVAMDEPLDKAGGYAIQGFGGRFVERIEGCYFNVVGLPVALLYRLLKEFGWHPESD